VNFPSEKEVLLKSLQPSLRRLTLIGQPISVDFQHTVTPALVGTDTVPLVLEVAQYARLGSTILISGLGYLPQEIRYSTVQYFT